MHLFFPLSSLCLLHSVRILLPVFHLSWLFTFFLSFIRLLWSIFTTIQYYFVLGHIYLKRLASSGIEPRTVWLGVENTDTLTCAPCKYHSYLIWIEVAPNNSMADGSPANKSLNAETVGKSNIVLEPVSSLRPPVMTRFWKLTIRLTANCLRKRAGKPWRS